VLRTQPDEMTPEIAEYKLSVHVGVCVWVYAYVCMYVCMNV
jgi:hypothetical protein